MTYWSLNPPKTCNLQMWKFQPWVMNAKQRVPRFLQRNLLLRRKCLRLSTILRLKETINTSTHPLRLVICRTEMSLEQWRGPCHLLPNTKDQSGPRISTWIQLVVPQTLILHSLSCVFIYWNYSAVQLTLDIALHWTTAPQHALECQELWLQSQHLWR